MAQVLKVVLVGINVLLLVVGIVLVALGIWAFLNDVEVINLANLNADGKYDGSFRSPGFLEVMAWISIGSGVITFFLAILALFGISKNSKWMLALYSGVLFLMLLMSAAIIGLGVVIRERLKNDLRTALLDGIVNQYEGIIRTQYTFSMAFDQAQVQFDCCGIQNYTDFEVNATVWTDRGTLLIPKTCCKLDEYQYTYERLYVFLVSSTCTSNATLENSNINRQCYDDIESSLMTKTIVLMAAACLIALLQIFGIVGSCCLMRTVKDNDSIDYKTSYGYGGDY